MSIQVPLFARDGTVKAVSTVDDEDAELARHHWYLDNNGYAARYVPQRTQLLHRAVLNLQPGDPRQGDHIDGDRLNNQRANLRVASPAENAQNRPSRPGTSSRYRGVFWNPHRCRWTAHVTVANRKWYLGLFEDEHEAGRVASEYRLHMMPFTNEDRMVAA